MQEPILFRAQLQEAESDGSMTARIVPFDTPVPYGDGRTVQFEAGGLETPDTVPLTVDHGDSVLDRIGRMTSISQGDDGYYARFEFSSTDRAQDVRTLLSEGAVTDVSIGVSNYSTTGEDDLVMSGTLDHVAVVARGRFGEAAAPSRVLSVHDDRSQPVDHVEEMATEPVAPVAEYDDTALVAEMTAMRDQLDGLNARFAEDDDPRKKLDVFQVLGATLMTAQGWKPGPSDEVAVHALADVVGDLGSADASGLSPDYYWAGGLQHNIDSRRPLFASLGSATFPSYGNNLTSARVSQDVAVGSSTAQKAEVTSQALQVVPTSFPVVWHKGAVDVAMELQAQSSPEVMGVIGRSFARKYARATNEDAAAKVQAAGTHTGAALDTSTYAAFVTDIVTTSNLIEDATGLPGNQLAVTPAQWTAILTLTDADDRRQFAINGPSNADGNANLTVRSINIAGVNVFRDYSAAVALQYNQESARAAERSPMTVSVTNVAKMGTDTGIIGATVIVHWGDGIYSYEI